MRIIPNRQMADRYHDYSGSFLFFENILECVPYQKSMDPSEFHFFLSEFGPTCLAGPDLGRSKIPFFLVLVHSEIFWQYLVLVQGRPDLWKVSGDWRDGYILISWPRSRWFLNLIDRRITITGHITWFLFSFLFLRRSFGVDFISRKGPIRITVRHAG